MIKIKSRDLSWLTKDPSQYAYFSDLLEIKNVAESFITEDLVINDVNQLKTFDHTKNDICFHLQVEEHICKFYENGNVEEDENNNRSLSDWYFLKILDDALDNFITPSIKEKYQPVIDKIKSVPNLTYATVQVWSNKLFIDRHVDDNSVTVVLILHNDDSRGCFLTIKDQTYDLKHQGIFCFNGDNDHELSNESGSNVTAIILRIRHEHFKIIS